MACFRKCLSTPGLKITEVIYNYHFMTKEFEAQTDQETYLKYIYSQLGGISTMPSIHPSIHILHRSLILLIKEIKSLLVIKPTFNARVDSSTALSMLL